MKTRLAVEDDPFLRLIGVILDPATDTERIAAYADFFAHDLADFNGWQVETTDLSEISVVTLETGFSADVTIDAFPGETLSGTITEIASSSDVVRGDVTYKVTVALGENIELPLRWGMTAFVTVDTSQ